MTWPPGVARDLGGDRVHVVVTLRNLGRLLPSSWQQYLKYGLTTPYEKWLTRRLRGTGRLQEHDPDLLEAP